MAKTIRERLVIALTQRGYTLVTDTRTRKYTVFKHPDPPGPGVAQRPLIYVGRAGALRGGLTVTTSIPYPNLRKKLLLEVAP